MTPSRRAAETANKRAERLRRKEAGEVRIEAWIDDDVRNRLVAGCHRSGITLARGIEMMVNDKWPASHPWAKFDWREG